jgi:hypothetical protein
MKNPDIQQLLEGYREGTLSDEELAELNRLTGRDAVMAAAGQRADGIIRRRRTTLFTIAGLLVAGATVWTLLPLHRSSTPMIAEAVVPEAVVIPEPAVEQLAPTTVIAKPTTPAKVATRRQAEHLASATDLRPATSDLRPATSDLSTPVVVCNNQCEADSVINDIWKFLTV